MPCYSPITGFKSDSLTKNGKRKLMFGAGGFQDLPVVVACGQCIGCRLERSRQWAMRCVHEAQSHEHKCFVTLTYEETQLPPGGTLVKKHFQDFMKRVRKRYGGGIRYFHCGEYGETTKRPHYHALLYGLDFIQDRQFHTRNPQGQTIYRSETLDSLWGRGFCTIGELNFETAAYTARYILKKVTGDAAADHYAVIDPDTGEITQRQPEYITMSLKPAIGASWYSEFKRDVFPDDFVILRGRKVPPPRYYFKKLEQEDAGYAAFIKSRRIRRAKKQASNNTFERLAVRREVKEAQIKSLKRGI